MAITSSSSTSTSLTLPTCCFSSSSCRSSLSCSSASGRERTAGRSRPAGHSLGHECPPGQRDQAEERDDGANPGAGRVITERHAVSSRWYGHPLHHAVDSRYGGGVTVD